MQNQQPALDHVDASLVGVKGLVKRKNENVYCLGTIKNGNFIANGIVVKNCDAMRYAIYTHFFGKEQARMSPQDLDRLYTEAMGGSTLPAMFRDTPGGGLSSYY